MKNIMKLTTATIIQESRQANSADESTRAHHKLLIVLIPMSGKMLNGWTYYLDNNKRIQLEYQTLFI